MREKLPSLIKIHLITALMTACSAGGNCILGIAYTSAVFEGKTAGWAGLLLSEIVMFFFADMVLFTKYTGMLAVMAAFTLISRSMRSESAAAGEVRGNAGGAHRAGQNDKHPGKTPRKSGYPGGAAEDIRFRSLYAGIGMTLLELTDSLFGGLTLQSIGLALWYGIACGILTALFSRGIRALLAGEVSFQRQHSESMISAACFLAAAAYAVTDIGFLPDFVLQSIVCLLLLYMGHAYGPAMGAVTGAAVGIVFSFSFAEISYLGILCFLGLLCGLFRDTGRFGQAIAFFTGTAGMMFCGVPFLTELRWLAGALAAGGLWIFCDLILTLRERCRAKYSGDQNAAECAGTFPGSRSQAVLPDDRSEGTAAPVLSDFTAGDVRMAEILGEFAREVLKKDGERKESYDENGYRPLQMEGRFWEEKYLETRETLAAWMSETGEILKNRHVPGSGFVRPEEELGEMLKKRLAERGVRVHEVWQKQNQDGQTVLRFVWSAGNGGERKQIRPVMVKDLLPVLNDSFGMTFESSSGNRSLVGKEQAVFEFVRVPNFKILHGSATTKKCEEDGNGDAFGVARIGTTQMLFGIADGVGSGRAAADAAAHTFEQLEQLLQSGVSEETALRLIDSLEILKGGQGAAVDFGVVNLNTGICHLLKAGGAPGFLLRGQWVEMLDAGTLPLGLLPGIRYEQKVKKLYDGDMILLVSDGVFQAFPGESRAEEIGNYLAGISDLGPKEIALSLLDRALSFGKAADDMSVLAIGVYEA